MLGRDLVTYIFNNNLMDEEVYQDGKLIGFLSDEEAAAKFDVGTTTIHVWINQGKLDGIRINETVFIPYNSKDPREQELTVPTIDLANKERANE